MAWEEMKTIEQRFLFDSQYNWYFMLYLIVTGLDLQVIHTRYEGVLFCQFFSNFFEGLWEMYNSKLRDKFSL